MSETICKEPWVWKIGRQRVLDLEQPLVMGVLNVTPDSFSDGGRFLEPERAVDRALEMRSQGADIIDVGGESTRPSAPRISPEVERQRVIPVIERLAEHKDVVISVDTQKAEVARLAVEAGALIVNDINAAAQSPEMLDLVAESGCGYVSMHMQGTPQTMQQAPAYSNVVAEVSEFFRQSLVCYEKYGVLLEQIVLDVGIGFGKTVDHNLELLRHLVDFKKHGRPLLLGVSRKSFLGKILGAESTDDRLAASLACVCWGMSADVKIFRVHDVLETSQSVRMWRAIGASK